jgi:hypothetical protein
MSNDYSEEVRFGATLVLDALSVQDISWLLGSLEEFARKGDIEAVEEFLEYAYPHLSANGLARIAGELGGHLRRRLEEVR